METELGICWFANDIGDMARWDKLSREQAVAITRYRLSQKGITNEDELKKYDECTIDGWDSWRPDDPTNKPWLSLRSLENPFDQSICDGIRSRSEELIGEGATMFDDSQDMINLMRAAGMNPNEDTIRRYAKCGYPKKDSAILPILAATGIVGAAIYLMTRKS